MQIQVLNVTLADRHEIGELGDRVPFIPIGPLVVGEQDVVETESMLRHVQEPHGHCTWPPHESDELHMKEKEPSDRQE